MDAVVKSEKASSILRQRRSCNASRFVGILPSRALSRIPRVSSSRNRLDRRVCLWRRKLSCTLRKACSDIICRCLTECNLRASRQFDGSILIWVSSKTSCRKQPSWIRSSQPPLAYIRGSSLRKSGYGLAAARRFGKRHRIPRAVPLSVLE